MKEAKGRRPGFPCRLTVVAAGVLACRNAGRPARRTSFQKLKSIQTGRAVESRGWIPAGETSPSTSGRRPDTALNSCVIRPQAIGFLALLLLLAPVLGGCVSKSRAQAQAQMAYLAGQRAAFVQMEQQKGRGPSVTLLGQVQNPVITWFNGLTLSQAIVNAHYHGRTDPTAIVVHRHGQEIPVNPKKLLQGEDFPLQAGDVVELQ